MAHTMSVLEAELELRSQILSIFYHSIKHTASPKAGIQRKHQEQQYTTVNLNQRHWLQDRSANPQNLTELGVCKPGQHFAHFIVT